MRESQALCQGWVLIRLGHVPIVGHSAPRGSMASDIADLRACAVIVAALDQLVVEIEIDPSGTKFLHNLSAGSHRVICAAQENEPIRRCRSIEALKGGEEGEHNRNV